MGRSLCVGRIAVGRSLCVSLVAVGRSLSVSRGRSRSVTCRSLVGHYESVTVGGLLWVSRYDNQLL